MTPERWQQIRQNCHLDRSVAQFGNGLVLAPTFNDVNDRKALKGKADVAERKWVHWTRGGAEVCDLTALSLVHSADLKSTRKDRGAFASPSLSLTTSIGRELQTHEIDSVR